MHLYPTNIYKKMQQIKPSVRFLNASNVSWWFRWVCHRLNQWQYAIGTAMIKVVFCKILFDWLTPKVLHPFIQIFWAFLFNPTMSPVHVGAHIKLSYISFANTFFQETKKKEHNWERWGSTKRRPPHCSHAVQPHFKPPSIWHSFDYYSALDWMSNVIIVRRSLPRNY